MAAPVAQKMRADFNVNGCNRSLEGKTVITTEENTHAGAVERFGLLHGSCVTGGEVGESAGRML